MAGANLSVLDGAQRDGAHTLFDGHVGPSPESTIEEAFRRFHRENPHVYRELARLARAWKHRRPDRKVGMKMLFEVLRWRVAMRTRGDDFKLNNNYHSYYARLLMAQEPDLAGLFETRQLHAREPLFQKRDARRSGRASQTDHRKAPDDRPTTA
jgi:hypothetical protein